MYETVHLLNFFCFDIIFRVEAIHLSGNPAVPYKYSPFDMAHDAGMSTAFLYSKQSLTFLARSWSAGGGADAVGEDNGANKIDVHGVDGVGNERHVALVLTLDRTAPWVRLISPSGDVVTDKDLQVEGFVELGAKVFVNEREVDTSYGHFLTTVSATEGPFNLHIVAMDVGTCRSGRTGRTSRFETFG